MLQRFYADNFRCLVNFELRPSRVQLLVGTNGAGKTSVLDVLERLRRLVVDGVPCDDDKFGEPMFGRKTRTRWQTVIQQSFELEVAAPHSNVYLYKVAIDESPDRRPRVMRETLDLNGHALFQFECGEMRLFNDGQLPSPSVVFNADWHQSGLAIVGERHDNKRLTWFKKWMDRLRPIQINPWEISDQSEREQRQPSRHLDNLADWFRHLQLENSEVVQAAVADLREAMPGLKSINARQAGPEYREIVATFQGPGGSFDLALNALSEGQRCLIGLYLLVHAQVGEGNILILDEPDNFIALREIQPWLMKAISRVEDNRGQLIIASHHPELLNQMAARGGLVLTRDGHGPTRPIQFPESSLMPSETIARGWEVA